MINTGRPVATVARKLGLQEQMRSCCGNAMPGSFFAGSKTQFYYRRAWPTKKRARIEVGKWIEDRYNRRRRHASLGQASPVAFEMHYLTNTSAQKKTA